MATTGQYECRHCRARVDEEFGADSPAEHLDAAGTSSDPRSPGDHVDCCDQCCYGAEACNHEPTT